MKRWLQNLALLAVASLIAGLLGEAAVRFFMKDQVLLYPRYHTDYTYGDFTLRGIRPHSDFHHTSQDGKWHFVTNEKGFRDTRDFAYAKPAGLHRVLVLGDSHTQGYEVQQDETYSSVLERYLAQHDYPAQVINTGVSGYGNSEEAVFLEQEGIRYQPDVVVLGFFENDFEDNFKAGLLLADDDGQLQVTKHEHIPGVRIQNFIYALPGIQWLSENSYLYSALFNGVWNFFKYRLTAKAAAAARTPAEEPDYAVATEDSVSPAAADLAFALIVRMQKFCAAHGIRLIMLDIPAFSGQAFKARPSLPPALRDRLRTAGIELVNGEELIGPYNGAANLHAPHGQFHISPLVHARIAVALGTRITAPKPGSAASDGVR